METKNGPGLEPLVVVVYNVYMMGKNEDLVLLAALSAGDRSPAAKIYQVLEGALEKGVSPFGAIYTTLDRMASKGWIDVDLVDDQKGRPRKHFSVTAEGKAVLRDGLRASSELGVARFAGVSYGTA